MEGQSSVPDVWPGIETTETAGRLGLVYHPLTPSGSGTTAVGVGRHDDPNLCPLD